MRVLLASILLIPYLISLSLNTETRLDSSRTSFVKVETEQSDTLVKMERTVCFGTCPSYTLYIQENGKVTFIGKEFVEHKGMAMGEMSKEKIHLLIETIRESHFMEVASNPECKSRYTDMPSVFLTIEVEGEQNSVSHYHGCKGFRFEKQLYDLETAIDSLAGTEKWIGVNN